MLILVIVLVVALSYTDAALVVAPETRSAVLGSPVTFNCSTDITSRPVNWYCSKGTCSANTTSVAVYLLLGGVVTDSYAHRISIVNYTISYVHNYCIQCRR